MGVRKALAHLFPAAVANKKSTGSKSDFWSDFSRNPGASQREEDQPVGEGEQRLNILVPFDFTPSSNIALDCALRMAQKRKAQVTLLHAIYVNLSPYGPVNLASIKAEMRQSAKAKISQMVDLAKQRAVFANYVIREGKPSAVIGNFIKEEPVDLVVLGCHRHRKLAGWLGRQKTVEKVIRAAPCPVLVLQTDEIKRILP